MKKLRFTTLLLAIFTVHSLWAQSSAQQSLEKFKAMVGTWTGKTAQGRPVEVTYRLIAAGASVMAESDMAGEQMTSMFYLDKDHLLMTHFCPSNNQPRMQATISPDLKTVSFDFLDATNLPSPQAGHMHHVTYVFVDPDHYSEEWTWKQEGKDTRMHFDLQRQK